MRQFINALSVLNEAGFINTDRELTYTYKNDEGGDFQGVIPAVGPGIGADFAQSPEPVREWFKTVFFNRMKRSTPEDQWFDPNERNGTIAYFAIPIASYVSDVIIDFAWGGVWSSEGKPSRALYGNGAFDYANRHKAETFARHIMGQFPEYAKDGYVMFPWTFESFANATDEEPGVFGFSMEELTDYLTAMVEQGQNIERVSFEQAVLASREWHEKAGGPGGDDVEGQDIQTVKQWPDGMRMVRILTPKGLDRESAKCAHCIGKGGYDRGVADGEIKIFSLRNQANEPLATIEVRDGNVIWQAKGRKNGPIAEEVRNHVMQFMAAAGLVLKNDHDKLGLERVKH